MNEPRPDTIQVVPPATKTVKVATIHLEFAVDSDEEAVRIKGEIGKVIAGLERSQVTFSVMDVTRPAGKG